MAATDDFPKRSPGLLKEPRLQEQVFRRVTGQGQFREGNQIGFGLTSFTKPAFDTPGVSDQIPDNGIHLDHGNTKHSHKPKKTPSAPSGTEDVVVLPLILVHY
jgi:hypothetical protein